MAWRKNFTEIIIYRRGGGGGQWDYPPACELNRRPKIRIEMRKISIINCMKTLWFVLYWTKVFRFGIWATFFRLQIFLVLTIADKAVPLFQPKHCYHLPKQFFPSIMSTPNFSFFSEIKWSKFELIGKIGVSRNIC